ncbi:MAG: hypothetical protein JW779_05785 [Candidatus Thorarchaeota archaeon]|nr:hypothetical protein [Candidatus Thorarchaeota archaeon]
MSYYEFGVFVIVLTCGLLLWLLLRNYRWIAVRLSRSLAQKGQDTSGIRGSWYVQNISTVWRSRIYHVMEITLPAATVIILAIALIPSSGYELALLFLVMFPLLVFEGFMMGSRIYKMRLSPVVSEEKV